MNATTRSILLTAALALTACAAPHEPAGDGGTGAHDGAHAQRGANASARWVEVRRPADRSLLEFPAVAVAAPASTALVSLSHPGIVRTIAVSPGDRVVAGDVVADVSVPELAAAAATVEGARRELTATEARHAQLEGLEKKKLVSRTAVFDMEARSLALRSELSRARAELASASATSSDQARLRRYGVLQVRAPIDGVVTDVSAVVGARVGAGEGTIASIRGAAAQRIEATLPREVPPAQKARFVGIDASRYDLVVPDAAGAGGVTSLDDGRRRAWFEFADPKARPPAGLRGRVELGDLPDDLMEVPLACVSIHDGSASVVVEGADGDHQRRSVTVVMTTESSALVRGPIEPGQRVSSDPAQVLMSAAEGVGHGH